MFADPQSLTLDTVATSFPRIGSGISEGRFRSATAALYDFTGVTFDLNVASNFTKSRVRSVIRLDANGQAPNPLLTGSSINEAYSFYTVYDRPINPSGIKTAADQLDFAKALQVLLAASTYAATVKLIGGES